MGLLYLLVGLACGVAVGMGIRKRGAPPPGETAAGTPNEEDVGEPPEHPRFPDVEYDLESE